MKSNIKMRVTSRKIAFFIFLAASICLLAVLHTSDVSSTYRDPRNCHSARFGCTLRFPTRPTRIDASESKRGLASVVETSILGDNSQYNASGIQSARYIEKNAEKDARLDKLALNGDMDWSEIASETDTKMLIGQELKRQRAVYRPNDKRRYKLIKNKTINKIGTNQSQTNCSVILRDDWLVRNCISRTVIGRVPQSTGERVEYLTRQTPGDAKESSKARVESFKQVFDTRAWGHGWDPTYRGLNASGMGATVPWTQEAMATLHVVINEIKQITGKTRVRMLDLPCGDMAWMSRFLKSRDDIDYTGIDIVPKLIESHKTVFKDYPWKFLLGDFLNMEMPGAYDLIFSRTLLQHLYMTDVFEVLGKISYSNSGYLLTTTWSRHKGNTELEINDDNPGRFRPLNLELPPLSLSPPLCLQRDGPPDAYQGWDHFLALWKLPLTRIKDCRLISRFTLKDTNKNIFSCVNWSP